MSVFRFKRFSVQNERSAMKIGTDAVLLGAAMTLHPGDRALLDIGTGTGVIALLAAQRLSDLGAAFRITGIDIDAESAAEAALNFASCPWADSLESLHLPLRDYTPKGSLDCIFSNPPYYDASLLNPDERLREARHTLSLSYREICSFSAENLAPGGRLSLILPSDCEKILLRTAASFSLKPMRLVRVRSKRSKPYMRLIAEFCRFPEQCVEEEIVLSEPNCTAQYYLQGTGS